MIDHFMYEFRSVLSNLAGTVRYCRNKILLLGSKATVIVEKCCQNSLISHHFYDSRSWKILRNYTMLFNLFERLTCYFPFYSLSLFLAVCAFRLLWSGIKFCATEKGLKRKKKRKIKSNYPHRSSLKVIETTIYIVED